MREQPEYFAENLINKIGNIEFAKKLCVQMIDEEKEWLTFFHQSENKNVKAATEKISYWEKVQYSIERWHNYSIK